MSLLDDKITLLEEKIAKGRFNKYIRSLPNHDRIEGAIHRVENKVKHGKFKILKKKIKSEALKELLKNKRDLKREKICAGARKTAHSTVANMKREVSNQVRNDLKVF